MIMSGSALLFDLHASALGVGEALDCARGGGEL